LDSTRDYGNGIDKKKKLQKGTKASVNKCTSPPAPIAISGKGVVIEMANSMALDMGEKKKNRSLNKPI